MKSVFLVDPVEGFKIHKDTSFALMLAAQQRGHELYILYKNGFTLSADGLTFNVRQVTVKDNPIEPFQISEQIKLHESELDLFFVRTDPPFDEQYLTHTWLLDRLAEKKPVINHPSGLRSINEKLWASQFTDFIPDTLITSDLQEARQFAGGYEKVIIKPLNGFGGSAVFLIDNDSPNFNVAFETLNRGGTEYLIIQAYLPAANEGDKRVLVLGGEPLGAILRLHSDEDHRNNFAAGGTAHATEITDREKEIINHIKPLLLDHGIWFAGLDFIGEHLIEVNITSPTCIREMSAAYNEPLELKVIEYAENMRNNEERYK